MSAAATSPEAMAWIRLADEEGIELPQAVQEARVALEKVAEQLDALPAPERVPSPEKLAAQGVALGKAQAEAEKLARKEAEKRELRRIGVAARDQARLSLDRALAPHRVELVMLIRPRVTEIIEAGREPAAVLKEYAPNFPAGDIAFQGTSEHLAAFQTAMALEKRLGLYLAAWRASTRLEFGEVMRTLDHHVFAEGDLYFAEPNALKDKRLTGRAFNQRGSRIRVQPALLAIASEPPEVGFRLAVTEEVMEMYEARRRALDAVEPVPDFRPRTFRARSI